MALQLLPALLLGLLFPTWGEASTQCEPFSFYNYWGTYNLRAENGKVLISIRRGSIRPKITVRGVSKIPIAKREGYPDTTVPALELKSFRIHTSIKGTDYGNRLYTLLQQIKRGKKVYLAVFNPLDGDTPIDTWRDRISTCYYEGIKKASTIALKSPIVTKYSRCRINSVTIKAITLISPSKLIKWNVVWGEGSFDYGNVVFDDGRMRIPREVHEAIERQTGALIMYKSVRAVGDIDPNPRSEPEITWIK